MSLRTHIGKLYKNVLAPVHYKASQCELLKLLRDAPESPERWIEITNTYRGRGWFNDISAWQVHSEFLQMQEDVLKEKPQVILEIGTAKGATLLGWCRMASKRVISVDLPGGIHGGGYPSIKQKLYRNFISNRSEVELHLIQADSHKLETLNIAKDALAGDHVDVLFIDGDHTYTGVKTDFELWSPLVRSGGIVIFHDILPHKHVADCEVDRLWNELKLNYEHKELIHDREQGWAGIGIIRMK